MRISNYSSNYTALFDAGELDLLGFLCHSRQLGMDGVSLDMGDLVTSEPTYLRQIRRACLDQGLSISMVAVSTDLCLSEKHRLAGISRAIEVAAFLGASLLGIYEEAVSGEWRDVGRRAEITSRVCEEASRVGVPVGVYSDSPRVLGRERLESFQFFQTTGHPNAACILDTGLLESVAEGLLEKVGTMASLVRHVRARFYDPNLDGSESSINYEEVFNILRSVHYPGFVEVVYEPRQAGAVPVAEALPPIVGFLRSFAGAAPTVTVPQNIVGRSYEGLVTDRYFADDQVLTEVQVAFLEGPAVDGRGHVFFTDLRTERIYRWDPETRQVSVFRENTHRANGLLFDQRGRLLACEGTGRITRTDMETGEISVLADRYLNRPLGGPNDLAADSRGRIYFTSRLSNRDPDAGNVNAVYRIDPDGSLTRVLAWPQIDMPNGIVISPDDGTLYLIDADGREDQARRIRAYELKADGTVDNERLLYDFYPGRSGDGMAIDARGNLYVAAGLYRRRGTSETLDTRPGIHVITPAGQLQAFVETPEDTITNCTFGGEDLRTLYITCGKGLLSLRTRIPGKASYRPA